jgi:hypothetical protein
MSLNDLSRHARTRAASVHSGMVVAGRRRRRAPTALLALAVVSAALGAGCSRGSGPTTVGAPAVPQASDATNNPVSSTSPRVRPPTSNSTAPTGPRADPAPTAAADLAAFFAAADVTDARIRAAAAAINRDIGPATVHVRRSTRTLILASAPRLPAKAIPAGMTPDLQRAVLLVHSELVARAAAFNGVDTTRTLPLTDPDSVRMLDAFRVGSVIAHRYPADLATARALAHASPPIRTVSPNSRQAAELALQIAIINGENNGCGSSGGYLYTAPRPVRWKTMVTDYGRFDGTIGGIMFAATYTPATAWTVELNAC